MWQAPNQNLSANTLRRQSKRYLERFSRLAVTNWEKFSGDERHEDEVLRDLQSEIAFKVGKRLPTKFSKKDGRARTQFTSERVQKAIDNIERIDSRRCRSSSVTSHPHEARRLQRGRGAEEFQLRSGHRVSRHESSRVSWKKIIRDIFGALQRKGWKSLIA